MYKIANKYFIQKRSLLVPLAEILPQKLNIDNFKMNVYFMHYALQVLPGILDNVEY